MSSTRRGFLESTAAMAAGMAGAACVPQVFGQSAAPAGAPMPMVKFGKVQISRLMVGANTFLGYGHYNNILSTVMKEWYTAARVVEVLQQCQKAGMNAFNYVHMGRAQADWERFLSEGGRMHIVAQAAMDDPTEMVQAVKPMGVWVQGERTDDAYRAGRMSAIRDYCKKLRDLGVAMVGVGSHIPAVLALVEEQGWDVDFYAGCVYNRRRTPQELRELLGNELPEMPNEVYLRDDPPRMYKVFQQTTKPCIAFKIMAAGRVSSPEAAFKLAFRSIKPSDAVCVGMFPRIKDEVKENALFASRHGAVAS